MNNSKWQDLKDLKAKINQRCKESENKKELTEEQVSQTEEQIKVRQKEIEEFIMTEKDKYLEAMGIQAD